MPGQPFPKCLLPTIMTVPDGCYAQVLENGSPMLYRVTVDQLEPRSTIVVQSEQFGRMGMASIRYCNRSGMKYIVGLEFSSVFGLSDPVRKKILEKVLRPEAAPRH